MGTESGFSLPLRCLKKPIIGSAFLLTLVIATDIRAMPGNLESEIKAEFIERFPHYIEWPTEAFAKDNPQFNVCIEDEQPMIDPLRKVLAKNKIKGKPAVLVILKEGESPAGC